MLTVSKTFLTAAAATMLMASPALAQSTTSAPHGMPSTGMSPGAGNAPSTPAGDTGAAKSMTASPSTASSGMGSAVMGLTVKGTHNTKIGKIDDVLVSPDGKVEKVVIDVGGVLGVGGKDVTVDWKDVQINSAERTAQVDMSKDQLKKAPTYHPAREAAATNTSR